MNVEQFSRKYTVMISLLGWTIVSYLCHLCSKHSLDSFNKEIGQRYQYSRTFPLVLTALQVFTSIILMDMPFLRKPENEARSLEENSSTPAITGSVTNEISAIIVFAHVSATYVTNVSLSLLPAESTFALKLIEPLVAAILSKLIIGWNVPLSTIVGLPLIVGGAFGFIGNPHYGNQAGRGILLAILSTVFLSVRNISMKGLHNENKEISFRSAKCQFAGFILCAAVNGILFLSGNARWIYPCLLGVLSSVFHLLNSYISTAIVLKHISVVSHAVASNCKRIIVVALLVVSQNKRLSVKSLLSLTFCSLGLLVYVKGRGGNKVKSEEQTSKSVPLHEQCNRLTFVFFVALVFGLLFYNIPLRLSRRDLHNIDALKLRDAMRYVVRIANQSVTG